MYGLFKIPKENTSLISSNTLHQQTCLTAKDQFEATKGECCLYGLDFTRDEQISIGLLMHRVTTDLPTQWKDL